MMVRDRIAATLIPIASTGVTRSVETASKKARAGLTDGEKARVGETASEKARADRTNPVASARTRVFIDSSFFVDAIESSTPVAVAPLAVSDKDADGKNDVSVAGNGALAIVQASDCGDGVAQVRTAAASAAVAAAVAGGVDGDDDGYDDGDDDGAVAAVAVAVAVATQTHTLSALALIHQCGDIQSVPGLCVEALAEDIHLAGSPL